MEFSLKQIYLNLVFKRLLVCLSRNLSEDHHSCLHGIDAKLTCTKWVGFCESMQDVQYFYEYIEDEKKN